MRYLLALLLASILNAQTVLPPGAATQEGFASDGNAWTFQFFRASCRYPASWINTPLTIRTIRWRADSTYATDYDRLRGRMWLRVGPWLGDTTRRWSTLPLLMSGEFVDPPKMVVTQAWTPQSFTFDVPLPMPVVIGAGGLEIDVQFAGPTDPDWGNRSLYWVDAQQNPEGGGTLADMWLDQEPPHRGCSGWISEARADRVPGCLTMEARDTGLRQMPGLIAIGASPMYVGCADILGTVFIPCHTDTGGRMQFSFPRPAGMFVWAWQLWLYNPARPVEQGLGSGHWCVWSYTGTWPCQTVYSYVFDSVAPQFSIEGAAWVVQIQ